MSYSTTQRITGMASGMDTETLVEGLLYASKTKLDNTVKKKTVLEWKQDIYSGVVSKLTAFQSKYFGTSSSSSTIFGSDLTKPKATSSSSYVSVTAGSASNQGSIYIADIVSLATSANRTSADGISADPTMTVDLDKLDELAGKSIDVTLDGVTKTVTFGEDEYANAQSVRVELQSLIDDAFGAGKVSVGGETTTEIKLFASNSSLQISAPSDSSADPSGVLDFGSYATNRVSLSASLGDLNLKNAIFQDGETSAEFKINGVSFTVKSTDTLSSVISKINASDAGVKMSYSSITDKITMVSTDTGVQSRVEVSDVSGNMTSALFGGVGGIFSGGTDAEVRMSLNGSTNESDLITVTRSTNTFDVDGTTVALKGMASGTEEEGVSISIGYDADEIVQKITDFVTDYNTLLADLNSILSEERDRDYEPLTDDEKDEMSEDEIELWTEKAKTGLLRNDSVISGIASQIRSSMNTLVQSVGGDGATGILAQIGITTGTYSEKGQLHIDSAALKAAIETDAEKVLNIFTQKSSISYSMYATDEQKQTRYNESGVIWRLSDLFSNSLSSYGKKGALIELVGTSTNKTNSQYALQISNIKEKIETMEDKLADEEERYWARFTAMEEALSTLQSQSSWISNMLGSSSS